MEQVQHQHENRARLQVSKAVHHRSKILVVEDDLDAQPIWERIIEIVDPGAVVRWATTEEGAEALIRKHAQMKDEFDVVVTDVMLGGEKTGVDLWRRFGGHHEQFLFTTGIGRRKFSKLIGEQENGGPFLVQKPLSPWECISCLRVMLGYSGFWERMNYGTAKENAKGPRAALAPGNERRNGRAARRPAQEVSG